jgi:hypothetical protein
MAEEQDFKLNFKRGNLDFTINRKDIISVDETPDGITLKIQGGISVVIDDMHMPQNVKQRVAMADTGFKKGNLLFNLNDYVNPVSLTP